MVGLTQSSFSAGEISDSLHGRVDISDFKKSLRTAENVFVHIQGGVSNRSGLEYVASVRDRLIPARLIPFTFSVTQAYVLEFGSQYFRIIRNGAHLKEAPLPIVSISNANPAIIIADSSYENGDTIYISNVDGMDRINQQYYILEDKDDTSYRLRNERTGVLVDSSQFGTYAAGGTSELIITVATPYAGNDVDKLRFTQSADILTLVHVSHPIQELKRISSLVWTIEEAVIAGDKFDGVNEYPGSTAYFEQRMVYGGTNNHPDTLYYSKTGTRDDFTTLPPVLDDSAIVATLNSRQVNVIQHIVPRNDLLVFTSGSEWNITAGSDVGFTPSSMRQKSQSTWGSSHIAPIEIGGTTLYCNLSSNVIRSFDFTSDSNSYNSVNIAIMADHVLTGPLIIRDWSIALIPYSVVWVVRSDGQALSVTYGKEQDIVGWCRHKTLGSFQNVLSVYEETTNEHATYFIVKRYVDGIYVQYIERMRTRIFNDVRDCFFVDSGLSYDVSSGITGVTNSTECTVTVESHTFSIGDLIDFSDIPEIKTSDNETINMTELNDFRYQVSVITEDTFDIIDPITHVPLDSSAFNEWIEGGKVRKAVSNFRGLDHLEGETVSILADGNVLHSEKVVEGQISIQRPASRVHIGLSYQANAETLDVTIPPDRRFGNYQGRQKKVTEITIRFKDSRGLFYGPNEDYLTEMKQRTTEKMGEPTRLSSEPKELIMPPSWNSHGRIYMRQSNPLPMTILSVSSNVEIGG